uniref:Secreted protein n=1 Tax=Leishmania guyanensis TaxID=5670 RepID=A0A1E1IZC4_LEIGU|nr:Hypothetical protein BN36_2332640 [Leishmania guyanensis]
MNKFVPFRLCVWGFVLLLPVSPPGPHYLLVWGARATSRDTPGGDQQNGGSCGVPCEAGVGGQRQGLHSDG